MTDDDRDLLLPRLMSTLALYLAFAVLPAVLLAGGSAWWAWERFNLPAGQHLVPMVERLGWVAAIAFVITVPVSILPALILGVRRIPGVPWRVVATILLVVAHFFLLALSLVSVGAVLGDALDGEHLRARVAEPGGDRRALLYQEKRDCGWAVYIVEPLDPVATQHTHVSCDCDVYPDAAVRWTGAQPELVDLQGNPYSCPSKGCASVATGPTAVLLLAGAALAVRRRRGPRAPAPGAR